MKIYLDNCCFNRPFDDQNQLKVRLEAEAKLYVQTKIIDKEIDKKVAKFKAGKELSAKL